MSIVFHQSDPPHIFTYFSKPHINPSTILKAYQLSVVMNVSPEWWSLPTSVLLVKTEAGAIYIFVAMTSDFEGMGKVTVVNCLNSKIFLWTVNIIHCILWSSG